MTRRVLGTMQSETGAKSVRTFEELTPQEQRVLELLAEGTPD